MSFPILCFFAQFKIHETTIKPIPLEKLHGMIILVLGSSGVGKTIIASMSVDKDVFVAVDFFSLDLPMADGFNIAVLYGWKPQVNYQDGRIDKP